MVPALRTDLRKEEIGDVNKEIVVLTVVGTIHTGVKIADLKEFAADALSSWGGQRHPGDLLFDSVNVTSVSAQRIATISE